MGQSSVYDRLKRSGPSGLLIAGTLEEIIQAVNDLSATLKGGSPHKANDATNVLTESIASNLDELVSLQHDLITKYEAHIANTDAHLSADNTNVVTDTTVVVDLYALLNELKIDLNAHMSDATAHTNADDVTAQVAGANATTKETAIALANEIRAAYEAHRVVLEDQATDPVHGAADSTNEVTLTALDSDATWQEIAALADEIRTDYEAHRQLTAGSVHAQADSTNTVTATAVGAVQTSINSGLNELKTDFNAHIANATAHRSIDDSMKVTTANASSLSTSLTLGNALREAYADHITQADEGFASAIPSLKTRVAAL